MRSSLRALRTASTRSASRSWPAGAPPARSSASGGSSSACSTMVPTGRSTSAAPAGTSGSGWKKNDTSTPMPKISSA
jgi:hypothetical protein